MSKCKFWVLFDAKRKVGSTTFQMFWVKILIKSGQAIIYVIYFDTKSNVKAGHFIMKDWSSN